MNKVILFLSTLLIVGCSTINKFYENDELIVYNIKDEFLLKSITVYKNEQLNKLKNSKINSYKKTMIILLSKDVNDPKETKYLNHVFNDSHIYGQPISGYFVYEQDTILVYSRKDRYINPWKYTAEFSSKMKVQLNDNQSKYKKEDGSYLDFKEPLVMNHSLYWKVKEKRLVKGDKNFNESKLLYGNKNTWGFDYDGKGDSLSLKIGKYN